MSEDGRFVAFVSGATNLVPNDTNGKYDVFRKDLGTGEIVLVSTDFLGAQGNGDARQFRPSISRDGRFIAFASAATNLVPGDTNGKTDVFRKDVSTGEIVRASVDPLGVEGDAYSGLPSMSPDGRYIAFESDASNLTADVIQSREIYRKDLLSGAVSLVSANADGLPAYDYTTAPSISASGRFVAFASYSAQLVEADANLDQDVFRKDLLTGQIVRASTDLAGLEANGSSSNPSLSADGRYVAFESSSTNLVVPDSNQARDVFRKDLEPSGSSNVILSAHLLRPTSIRSRQFQLEVRFKQALDAYGAVLLVRGSSPNLSPPHVLLARSKDNRATLPISTGAIMPGASAWIEFEAMGQTVRAVLKR